jgi:FKBP-type peptidyl-prolyl cis-trans isomerase
MINSRTILIGAFIILIVGGVGYEIMAMKTTPAAPAQNTQTQGAPVTTADTASTTQPQVQAQDVTVGTGIQATPGSVVSVLYEGKLNDGTIFDSSAAHGNQPLIFALGTQGMIPGFQIGVNGMKVGGERTMVIPPALGYGTQDVKDQSGKIIIPANSAIQFNVKLVNVQTLAEAQAQAAKANKAASTTKAKK